MNSEKTFISRRRIVKGSTVTAGAVALAGVTSWYGSQPAIAAHVDQWTASDTGPVQKADGVLDAVHVEPTIDIEWDNFTTGADSVDITLKAHLPSTTNDHIDEAQTDTIFDEPAIDDTTLDDTTTTDVVDIENVQNDHDGGFDTLNGGVRIYLDNVDITNGGDITEDYFTDDTSGDGESQKTAVDLELQTEVNGAQAANPTATLFTTFHVDVENEEETSTTGGTAGTSAE